MEVIDDFLPFPEFKSLQNVIMGQDFPWFFNEFVDFDYDAGLDDFQFTHLFYTSELGHSNYIHHMNPILKKLNIIRDRVGDDYSPKYLENINDRLLRIKANLLPRCGETKRHSFHKDLFPHFDIPNRLTAIYYVNTNNGWTEFENGDKVPSVENRILIFDSSLPHTGTRATNASSRVVINFNYVSSWG